MGNQEAAPEQTLPTFEEAKGLGPQDSQFVRDLVEVLEKHGNLDRFGLCLLHEHFPVAGDEVLVETHDLAARTLQIRVEKAGATGHTKPSQWRFVKTGHDSGEVESHAYQVILQCSPISGCPGSRGTAR
ncbi:hypothetical protein ACIG0C_24605 [Kitasatospora aureofaciens]|uniref:Uncharacterized protein n=1 Tax=Kitasatospora aureofaciens TaxID=1894 RepID=A0A1E7N900_KITAU|nr:hypothetical protein [Kitasatospora aureofaciens]ARF81595.1 hypothetical protein B6264_24210 [Kitasatospora aureofaciens]OEV37138.1 hypothetical protein HS99_0004785 [Kitasatospora aureofaciens]UKZ03274.1 hypothetical protein BOQ63_003980 [Streptomyces viridifaciens]GGU93981.1 hypothetical protein GCM10010502_54620 [Kitasatospora aureofaciens]